MAEDDGRDGAREVPREGTVPESARHAGDVEESPLDLSASGWRATLKRTLHEVKRDRVPLTAAGVAFYWFLTVFPLVIAGVGMLALVNATDATVEAVQESIRSVLPGDAAAVLTGAVQNAAGRAAGTGLVAAVVGIALAVWSASSGMAAAQVGLDVAYDVEEDRTFLKKRAMGMVLVLVALLLGGIASALLVFGQPIGEAIREHVPGGAAFEIVWTVIRWALAFLAVATLFALFYFIGPNRKPPSWKWLSPGGLLATLLWLGASFALSFYVSHFGGSYAKTYGSLVGVVVLLLWLFVSALALLLGAELNGELERQRARRER
ncbi:MAG TPA: YihY/virulence factor BrkB family protein [Actinomycetota bacterium]|nr:YihY/virulence factor BrkB family protein [Actinomycetota bacterium]